MEGGGEGGSQRAERKFHKVTLPPDHNRSTPMHPACTHITGAKYTLKHSYKTVEQFMQCSNSKKANAIGTPYTLWGQPSWFSRSRKVQGTILKRGFLGGGVGAFSQASVADFLIKKMLTHTSAVRS